MSSFVLKMIGIVTMLFDHSGYVLFGKFSFFNYIGRIAFPIFAFGISEGYTHTKDLKKYFMRLGIFALISQLPYYLLFSCFTNKIPLNIFFTLFMGLLAITVYDKATHKWVGLLLVAILVNFSLILPFDYSWYGILLIFTFYLSRNHKLGRILAPILVTSIYSLFTFWGFGYPTGVWLWLFTLLPIVLIQLYNGKKGKDVKYLLYLFYPLHLLILYVIFITLY